MGRRLVVAAIVRGGAARRRAQQFETGRSAYGTGQNVAPVYEGWEKNPDGSFNMVFGYMNRNYDERPEIPIGPNNSFSPEPADRGQPTHFYPRRQQFMFRVRVPANFGKQQLVWTLTRAGKTEKAVGKLDLEWEISQVVISQNRARAGQRCGHGEAEQRRRRSAAAGSAKLTARVGEPLALSVNASDDGMPEPPKPHPARGARRARRDAAAPRHDPAVVTRSSSRSFSRAARGLRSPGRSGGVPDA